MKIKNTASNIADYIAYQRAISRRVALEAELNSQTTSNETLSRFKKLQYKAALNQEVSESGFLPKLDSRLAMALTAMNSNEKQNQFTGKIVYSRPTELDIES